MNFLATFPLRSSTQVKKSALPYLLILSAMLCVGATVSAQSSDDVHVVPNEQKATGTLKREAGSEQADSARDMRTSLMSVHVDLVLVPVTVTDSMNRPVMGLTKDNFLVYEDQKQQQIRYFSKEDEPISVGILLDLSGTMANKIDAAREALGAFFRNCHPDDDYFVITFANRPKLLADTTRSIGDIEASLATVQPFGYTALLDAIDMALVKLRSARYKRRAVLIISDGGDNVSRHKLREVKSEVEESGVEVYAIGMFDDGLPILKSFDEKIGKHLLSEVTEASGGRTLTVANLAKLSDVAETISMDMRNQYVLGYEPRNSVRNGKWRKIRVQVLRSLAATEARVWLHPAYKKGYTAPLH